MKYLAILLILGVVVLAYACTPKTAQKVTEVTPSEAEAPISPPGDVSQDEPAPPVNSRPAFVSASIEKTPCYGKCPAFTMEFNATGIATYHGKRHVKKMGKYEAKLSSEQQFLILEKAQKIGFFDMSKTYPTDGRMIADFPMTITNIKFGRQNKTVTNNSDAPQELVDYENFLLELGETLQWEKLADE